MGIRFLCGHCGQRLNVKAYQAGQSGVCPHCKGQVMVPTESTIERKKKNSTPHSSQKPDPVPVPVPKTSQLTSSGFSSTEQFEFDGAETQQLAQYELRSGDVPNVATQTNTKATESAETRSAPTRFKIYDSTPPRVGDDPFADEPEPVIMSAPKVDAAAKSGKGIGLAGEHEPFVLDKPDNPLLRADSPDPIAEAPEKVWYIRHPKKGEKGPLKGKLVREMLDAAEIDGSCFVWREDWEDWEKAILIFREIPDLESENNPDAERMFTDPKFRIPQPGNGLRNIWRRYGRNKQIMIVGAILSGIAIIGWLGMVLMRIING